MQDSESQQASTDFDTPIAADLGKQRRKWFVQEMSNSRRAYTQDRELVLFTGTWNVNGRSPDPSVDISPWLFPDSLRNHRPVDIYMLGLQEVQTLSGVDAVRSDAAKGQEWEKRIQSTLHSDYDLVATRQLVGIMVFVFVRKNHIPYLSNIQLSYAATGFLNAGNKGGVAARFKIYNRTLCCVACHLAAHTANVERRNQDFSDVCRKAGFLPEEDAHTKIDSQLSSSNKNDLQPTLKPYSKSSVDNSFQSAPSLSSVGPSNSSSGGSSLFSLATAAANVFYDMSAGANTAVLNNPNAISVLDHDVVFWLGDLNYRIEGSTEKVLEYIRLCDWDSLYQFDQLQKQMKICEAFVGFKEGPIQFAPTYKLERYENEYAKDENGAYKRIPAYTDRILWRFGVDEDDPNGIPNLSLDEYASAQSVLSSDHRPVYGLFQMTFGVEDFVQKRKIEEKINRELDVRQAQYKPSLQISSPFIDFGNVFFEQESEKSISIRNVGSVSTKISIKTPTNLPQWLIFDASRWQRIEILPGKAISLNMRVFVCSRNGMADSLFIDGCKLKAEVLIVTPSDSFNEPIEVTGRYIPTTLGLAIETLSMLPDSVLSPRRSQQSKPRDTLYKRDFDDDQRSAPGSVPLAIPKEIWLLADALMRTYDGDTEPYLNKFPSLFLSKVDSGQVDHVLSFVDRAQRIPPDISGDAIAACLLLIFEKMDESIITHHAYKRAIEAGYTDDEHMTRAVTDLLPPLNRNVLWYIVGLLCEIPAVRKGEERGRQMANALSRVMIRGREEIRTRDDRSKSLFLQAAIRFQLRVSPSDYSAVIDMTNPQTHPRKLTRTNV